MQFELDTHTHTIASAHAYSTIQEMAQAAAGKGLKLLAITDHAPGYASDARFLAAAQSFTLWDIMCCQRNCMVYR